MRDVELHHGAATDVGLVREVNEDSYLADPPVFVVADGMGGHDGGDVASAIVVEEFADMAARGYDATRAAEEVAATLERCQLRIEEYAARQPGPFHAGTTAVVALIAEHEGEPAWLLANLGDSRAYRLTGGRLHQVSVDHSVVQELVETGVITADAAAHHPERHVITRALGGTERNEADFFLLPLGSVDRLVLCSDGITGMVDDDAMREILQDVPDPRDAADALVAAALAGGGRDNATVVVVDVVGSATSTYDSESQRLSLQQKLGTLP